MAGNHERRNTLPIVYTSGTYYQVGFDIGRTFRGMIEDYLASIKEEHQKYLDQFSSGQGLATYQATMATLQENYPHYQRELQGIADGARIPFYHLMVLHLPAGLSTRGCVDLGIGTSVQGTGAAGGTRGCSSVSVNLKDQVLLGHTEDASKELLNHIYLVDAHIKEDDPQGRWGCMEEKFTALTYAGELPGFCMGYNHHGLVYSVNVIRPQHVHSGKTPVSFLCRALLSAESMEAAHLILKDKGVGASYGIAINVDFASPGGSHTFHNLEMGPVMPGGTESQLSVKVLKTGDNFFHANKILHLDVEEVKLVGLGKVSSKHRHDRVKQLHPPTTRQRVLDILSDTQDAQHPIFRTSTEFITTALGLFDMMKKTWTLWINNPKVSKPLMTHPLTFKWDV